MRRTGCQMDVEEPVIRDSPTRTFLSAASLLAEDDSGRWNDCVFGVGVARPYVLAAELGRGREDAEGDCGKVGMPDWRLDPIMMGVACGEVNARIVGYA